VIRKPRSLSSRWTLFLSAALLGLAGCAGHRAEVRGRAPSGSPTTVARLASARADSAVTVRGTMIEKCPTAGCWFMLQDNTGRVRVDLKAAGFVVTDVPTGGAVSVSGRLRREGEEPVVVASGARFE
jgi:uncharacterized protein YdeI (BOF family)